MESIKNIIENEVGRIIPDELYWSIVIGLAIEDKPGIRFSDEEKDSVEYLVSKYYDTRDEKCLNDCARNFLKSDRAIAAFACGVNKWNTSNLTHRDALSDFIESRIGRKIPSDLFWQFVRMQFNFEWSHGMDCYKCAELEKYVFYKDISYVSQRTFEYFYIPSTISFFDRATRTKDYYKEYNTYLEKNIDTVYYCTKKVSYPMSYIMNNIISIFEEAKVKKLDIDIIYRELQIRLGITSVNRKELYKLIVLEGSKDQVFLDYVKHIFYYVLNEEEIEEYFDTVFNDLKNNISRDKDSIRLFDHDSFYNCFISYVNYVSKDYKNFAMRVFAKEFVEFFLRNNNRELLFDDEARFFEKLKKHILYQFEYKKIQNKVNLLKTKIDNISKDNKKIRIDSFKVNNCKDIFEKYSIVKIGDLSSLSYEQLENIAKEEKIDSICKIIDGMSISIIDQIRDTFVKALRRKDYKGVEKTNKDWEKYAYILTKRAEGNTLEASGKKYDLCRERVRQIEYKFEKKFSLDFSEQSFNLISVLRDLSLNQSFIKVDELSSLINEYSSIFIFALKNIDSERIKYLEELDIFEFISEFDWYEELLQIAMQMSSTISVDEMVKHIDDTTLLLEELGMTIPKDYVSNILLQGYENKGTLWIKGRMSLAEKYKMVLEKHFKNGMRIYDPVQMKSFKAHYFKMFNEHLSEEERPIHARIEATCILCDKGTYMARPTRHISKELLQKITNFIENSEFDAVLYREIFYEFEDDLLQEGISNRYYLQGLLKLDRDNRFFYTREYISKSKEFTSIYNKINDYVRDNNGPVSRDELRNRFPAISDAVITSALMRNDIVNGFAMYYHKDFLDILDTEQLHEIVSRVLQDEQIHNVSDVLDLCKKEYSEIIEKLKIDGTYSMFSILEYYFANEFSFNRPYIAHKYITITDDNNRILTFMGGRKEVSIVSLKDFVKDKNICVFNYLRFFNELNDSYLLKDKNTLINKDALKINNKIINDIEAYILNKLNQKECVILSKHSSFIGLPYIGVPWNEWLIYSLANKYCKSFKSMVTNKYFNLADPIFIRNDIGVEDMETLKEYIKGTYSFNDYEVEHYIFDK